MYFLVVTSPFLGYAVGQVISDPATIASIEAGQYQQYVVRVAANQNDGESLSVGVIAAYVGSPLVLAGQVLNATPAGLDYSLDHGTSWTAVGHFVLRGAGWSGTGPTFASIQSGTILVRDHVEQTVLSQLASFSVVLAGNAGNGTLALADGSAVVGVGAGLAAGTLLEPAPLAVQFGTLAGTVADGGLLAATATTVITLGTTVSGFASGITAATAAASAAAGSLASLSAGLTSESAARVSGDEANAVAAAAATATANAALASSGGTLSGSLAFSAATATLSATSTLCLAPGNQLWLGAQNGTGAVYSATIADTTSNPSTVIAKLWNNGGVACLSNGSASLPAPGFGANFTGAQPWADLAANAGIFSHHGGVVPVPPAPQSGLCVADKWKLSGVYNFAEIWQPSQFTDCWMPLQDFLLYAQLMFLAQSGSSLGNIAERQFVDVVLPAGKYYVSQPLIIPEYVRFGGPGIIVPTPYVGAQTGGTLVSGAFDSSAGAPYAATAQFTPAVIVCPRAHLADLNICVAYDGSFAHKSSGVVFGKNWQPVLGSAVTIGNPGSGYSVGDTLALAQPSVAPFSPCVVTITAVNGSGGITAATVGPYAGDFALPAVTYGSGPNLQAQQWSAGNGFSVFDPNNTGCFITTNYGGTRLGAGATLGLPDWVADFNTGANQYNTGAALTNGSQAGRIQISGGVDNNYSANYGPTFNVMLSGLECEIDSIQGLGGKAGLWARYAQDYRINRLNFVDSSIYAWFSGAGSIECPNCVADTCGAVLQIDQSHGIVMRGRAFFEEGNIVNPLPACNVNGAAFLIGATSTAAYPVTGCDIAFTVFNMGGLPASTIAAKGLTGVPASTQAACCSIAYAVANRIALTVSNLSQYGAVGGSPYPNPSPLPTSGIYLIGQGVDASNVLLGSIDTVPVIDGVAPPGPLVSLTSGHGYPGCAVRVWDGLHQCWIGPQGVVEIFGSSAPSGGTGGTGAGFAVPTSVYRNTASGISYRNTGTTASPTWTTP
jgi:hypothetical protein